MGRKNYSKFSNNKQNVVVDKPSFEAEIVEIEDEQPTCLNVTDNKKTVIEGFVTGCDKLNVRKEPNKESEVICVIDKDSKVVLESIGIINGFYKISTAYGAEGYCMEKYIKIK